MFQGCDGLKVFHAGEARVSVLGSSAGVYEVAYSGRLNADTFSALRTLVLREVGGAAATIIRMDGAVCDGGCDRLLDVGEYSAGTPPAAVVVSPSQYDLWAKYARAVAARGAMRAVFLAENLSHAKMWANRHALVRP